MRFLFQRFQRTVVLRKERAVAMAGKNGKNKRSVLLAIPFHNSAHLPRQFDRNLPGRFASAISSRAVLYLRMAQSGKVYGHAYDSERKEEKVAGKGKERTCWQV